MLKKIVLLVMAILINIPGIALAGSAYLTEYLVNPITTMPNGAQSGVWTAIHVTNILSVPQTVTIVLYSMDGTPLVNQPLVVYNGSIPSYAASINSNGEISVVVQGMARLAVELIPSGVAHSGGWGIIKGSVTSGVGASLLLADANEYGALPDSYAGTAYNKSIPINGGKPF